MTKCQNANAGMLHGHMGRNVVCGAMAIIVNGNTWCNNSVITKIAVPVLFVLYLCCACQACAVPVLCLCCTCAVHVLSVLLPALSTLACPVYVVM